MISQYILYKKNEMVGSNLSIKIILERIGT